MQKLSELLNIKLTENNPLKIFHPIFKDKIIYQETSDGYWFKYEFDSNGNEIYFENYEDYWNKKELDSNGNQLFLEDSDGFWIKKEFDLNGNQIYYEDNYGTIEDNRVTELTIDQIAEKFGISVEKLKIK